MDRKFQDRLDKIAAENGGPPDPSSPPAPPVPSPDTKPRIARRIALGGGAVLITVTILGMTQLMRTPTSTLEAQGAHPTSLPRYITLAGDLLGGGKLARDLEMSYVLYQFESGKITSEQASLMMEHSYERDR